MSGAVTWQNLPKSVDDPTTIEEKIIELIATHNAAAPSHDATGQSLYVHRTNDPLNHDAVIYLKQRTSDPAGAPDGAIYYKSDTDQVRVKVNGSWVTIQVA